MSILLPPTIALSSPYFNNSYLNYDDSDSKNNDASDSEKYGCLKVNGENVFSPLAKFEVLTSNTGTELVHLRCWHNKKFLRRTKDGAFHISPEADDPVEDEASWSCTLFQPEVVEQGNAEKVRLFHVQSKRYATAFEEEVEINKKKKSFKLHATAGDQNIYDIIDLETLVILPKHLAFRGPTGDYLKILPEAKLKFRSSDKRNPDSWFVVSTDGHGRVQIQSYTDKIYLFNSSDRIWYDERVKADDPRSFFWPVKVDSNTVALKSNNKFCAQTSDANGNHALNVAYTSITSDSLFVLEELVLSRRIYNTDFDLKNAIIYDESPVTMATAFATNDTSVDNTVEFKFTYTQSVSCMWSARHSWMVGMTVEAKFEIPFIAETGVSVSGEYTEAYEWGLNLMVESTVETTYTATVPANSSISVKLMATRGKCDVPYSYYQKDVLYNGKTVVYKKDDGLYTGANPYNFRYQVTTHTEPEPKPQQGADSKSDSPATTEMRMPDPAIHQSKQKHLPLPVTYGSTKVQTSVTSTTVPKQALP